MKLTRADPHTILMAAARRFDLGNYNYSCRHGLRQVLGHHRFGGHKSHRNPTSRASPMVSLLGLLDLGLPVAGGEPGPHIGSIVSVGEFGAGGHDTTDDPRIDSLYRHLTGHRVRLSVRQGMLRHGLPPLQHRRRHASRTRACRPVGKDGVILRPLTRQT